MRPSESGFFEEEGWREQSSTFTDIAEMNADGGQWCRLMKARRYGKWFILKTLRAEYKDQPRYLALLKKEFEIAHQMDHPNIVQTLAIEQVPDVGLCIVQGYIEGRTLRQAIDEERWTAKRVTDVMEQTADALAYIHARQTVHRDLKPENIMLTTNGDRVKLIDFGLSDADDYSALKQPAGTLRYAAPEQIAGVEQLDARADIYSLGVILNELADRLPPYDRPHFRRIARRCTRTDRERRPSSVKEIRWQNRHRAIHWSLVALAAIIALVFMLRTNRPTTLTQPQRDTIVERVEVPQASEIRQEEIPSIPQPVQPSESTPSPKPSQGQQPASPTSFALTVYNAAFARYKNAIAEMRHQASATGADSATLSSSTIRRIVDESLDAAISEINQTTTDEAERYTLQRQASAAINKAQIDFRRDTTQWKAFCEAAAGK